MRWFIDKMWMGVLSDMRKQDKSENPGRYGSWKLPVVLSEMQAWNTDCSSSTEYVRYQRARRTDAEPITHKAIPLWLSAFFISIYDDNLPRPTGKEKNRCRAGCFRALNIHIPAAVLKHNSRPPFSMPSYWRRPDAGEIGGLRREPPWSKERFDKLRQATYCQKKPVPSYGDKRP